MRACWFEVGISVPNTHTHTNTHTNTDSVMSSFEGDDNVLEEMLDCVDFQALMGANYSKEAESHLRDELQGAAEVPTYKLHTSSGRTKSIIGAAGSGEVHEKGILFELEKGEEGIERCEKAIINAVWGDHHLYHNMGPILRVLLSQKVQIANVANQFGYTTLEAIIKAWSDTEFYGKCFFETVLASDTLLSPKTREDFISLLDRRRDYYEDWSQEIDDAVAGKYNPETTPSPTVR